MFIFYFYCDSPRCDLFLPRPVLIGFSVFLTKCRLVSSSTAVSHVKADVCCSTTMYILTHTLNVLIQLLRN